MRELCSSNLAHQGTSGSSGDPKPVTPVPAVINVKQKEPLCQLSALLECIGQWSKESLVFCVLRAPTALREEEKIPLNVKNVLLGEYVQLTDHLTSPRQLPVQMVWFVDLAQELKTPSSAQRVTIVLQRPRRTRSSIKGAGQAFSAVLEQESPPRQEILALSPITAHLGLESTAMPLLFTMTTQIGQPMLRRGVRKARD
jgi:hypothetical protein